MFHMDWDLKKYLQKNRQLTWKERIQITVDIINALDSIHRENEIHRDLLYIQEIFYTQNISSCGI